jgi:hypothetical protein
MKLPACLPADTKQLLIGYAAAGDGPGAPIAQTAVEVLRSTGLEVSS